MFCTKCGSELQDGVRFCTNCGAPLNFVSAPASPAAPETQTPAAPAAEQAGAWQQPQQPRADAWQQPQQPQADAWQQPQQPQAGTWQQPQQPQAGPWQQPQQPQANGWQQPQQPQQTPPPQWQQIQQQWQQQQQQQQQWSTRQQPQQQQWQQPQTRGGQSAPKAKKSGKGAIIAIIAAVLAVVVGVGGFVWPGFFKKDKGGSAGDGSFSMARAEKAATPEEFYQIVETNNADILADHLSSAYDNIFLSNATSDDICAEGSLRVEPGDKLREMLIDAVGAQLDQINPGDDLKWLKDLTLGYDVSKKNEDCMINLGLKLNGSDLLHLKLVIDLDKGDVWLSVPELSDKYMQTTLEDLNLDSLDLDSITSGMSFGSVLGDLSAGDAGKLDPVSKAMPVADTANALLRKYLNEAIECIDDVERDTGDLSAQGVSAGYTVLTSTITPETVVKIVQKIGPELKEDKEIKKIILDVAAAAEEEGETKYKEFTDRIDELLDDPSKITDSMTDDIVMTVYLDKSGDVHGRVIDAGSQKLEMLMPEKDGQFGLSIRYTKDGEELLLVSGDGKRSGDKLTGDLELEVKGEYYADLHLDGFDIEKAKDGFFSGGIEVKPTASFWKLAREKMGESSVGSDIPEALSGILDTLTFRFDLDTSKDKAAVSLTLTNGKDKLVTIAIDGKKTSAKKISTVDGIEASEWAQEISLDKLEKVVASIEKAGVPAAYTDLLDAALDNAF